MTRRPEPAAVEFRGTRRFELVKRLGGGGMGVVHEAYDREQRVRVALKTMRYVDPKALLRFKNEFRALAEVHHPNLLRLFELFEDGGQWFFTMELVEGVDLIRYVRGTIPSPSISPFDETQSSVASDRQTLDLHPGEGPPATLLAAGHGLYDEARLRRSFSQLGEGLAALHRAGHVHRDIKPSNILVTDEGRVVILDFGLVKQVTLEGHRAQSSVAGTIAYMAPEQAGGLPLGPPADWYSTGVMLYEALTGRAPYLQPAIEVLLGRVQQTPPPRPRDLSPVVPADLEDLCLELLSREPELRPTEREILRRLRVESLESSELSAPEGVFIGRERELAQLRHALTAAQESARVVLVDGASGVGKSALLRRFGELVAGDPAPPVVLAGRCHERESLPFKAVDGVVDALSRWMARLPPSDAVALLPRQVGALAQVFPVLLRVDAIAQAPTARAENPDPQERRARVFAALKELLARIADRWPLALVVDGMQWADDDSLALLDELLRPPDAPTLLFIATLRTGGEPQAGRRTPREIATRLGPQVETLHVENLPPDDAQALARSIVGGGPGDDPELQALAAEADGHPLFLGVLARRRLHGQTGPVRLDEALWSHIERLGAEARGVLELVAVAGAPIDQDTIARAAQLDFEALTAQASLLRAASLVSVSGARRDDPIEPFHDRVRDATLNQLPPEKQRALHERLALALETAGRLDPEAVGLHWLGAGNPLRAGYFLRQAANEAAEALAFDRAVRLYGKCLEVQPHEGEAARELHTRLGDALHAVGRGVEAARAYLAAAALASGIDAIELRRRAAEHLLRGGHIDEGLDALRTVLASVKLSLPGSPSAALAQLLVRRAQLSLRGLGFRAHAPGEVAPETLVRVDVCGSAAVGVAVVDPLIGAYFQTRYLQLALAAGEPARICKALAGEAVDAAARGHKHAARAHEILETARALATQIANPLAEAQVAMGAGISTLLLGDFRAGLEHSERAARLYRERCSGVGWELGNTQVFAVLSLVYLGELAQLRERLPRAAREAEERGDLHAMITLRSGHAALAWLADDDPESARREVDAMSRVREKQQWSTQRAYYEPFANAHIDLYLGDARAAHDRLQAAWPTLEKSFLLRLEFILVLMTDLRARAALSLACTDAAQRPSLLASVLKDARTLDGAGAAASDGKLPWAAGLAELLRSGVASLKSDLPTARAHAEAAARLFTAAHMSLHAAVAHRRLSELGAPASATTPDFFTAQSIRNPARWTSLLGPGTGP